MADKAGISWTDATWNVVTGCTKDSAGCKFCYAERDWPRTQHLPIYAGRKFTDIACHPERLDMPLRWKRARKIFVNSVSDLFHDEVPFEFIDQVFAVMGLCFVMDREHTFQILTKRAERMRTYLRDPETVNRVTRAMKKMHPDLPGENSPPVWPLPNVWLGVSVEDQDAANARLPVLLDTPAAVRWVSMEPLLAPVDLTNVHYAALNLQVDVLNGSYITSTGEKLSTFRIDWVVVGGESGPAKKSRPMNLAWVRRIHADSEAAGVLFFFKQTGSWEQVEDGYISSADAEKLHAKVFPSVGGLFRYVGRGGSELLDGVEYHKWPAILANQND